MLKDCQKFEVIAKELTKDIRLENDLSVQPLVWGCLAWRECARYR